LKKAEASQQLSIITCAVVIMIPMICHHRTLFDSIFFLDYPFGWPSFDCVLPGNETVVEDVHRLSPWHISIVGAIGDSLTAGRAAGAKNVEDLRLDYQELSFATGHYKNLTKQVTLANIFSYFSPRLVGCNDVRTSGFNVAKSGACSSDLNQMSEASLIASDPRVDFSKDWKFINVFIGTNDLCKICLNQTKFGTRQYAENMQKAILYLRDNLPRSYVNILPPLNIDVLQEFESDNPFCVDVHRSSCPCLFQQSSDEIATFKRSFEEQLGIFSSKEYQTNTFAVGISHALNITKKSANLAYVALDCFHFSEIAHDLAAKVLWSDLFKAIPRGGSVDLNDFPPQQWECPYLKTALNSENCSVRAIVFFLLSLFVVFLWSILIMSGLDI
uniref:Lipase_GDSL domain-containing protein n=1 Tax=Angiostrongylus cantonensis TaxID=6313 RepID=A0A158PCV3_ANGCA